MCPWLSRVRVFADVIFSLAVEPLGDVRSPWVLARVVSMHCHPSTIVSSPCLAPAFSSLAESGGFFLGGEHFINQPMAAMYIDKNSDFSMR
jgi:hypothetical protein